MAVPRGRSSGSLGVVSARGTAALGLALLSGAALGWVFVPPFPPPATLVDKPYAALVTELGRPSGGIPTKFVAWEKSRGGAIWTLEAGFDDATIDARMVAGDISRCLWIDWAGVSILCEKATRPGHLRHDS